jgi:2-polyprenyl-3-methyl-5-hydroxy-6-metoxy-1,4-benzoquinol methylase
VSRRSPAARGALSLYGAAPLGDRFHVRVRWLTCPIPAIEQRVPDAGRVLDLGCGHGLVSFYLALSSSRREVHGVDIDPHKIALARSAARAPGAPDVTFDVVEPGVLPDGPWDAVVIADVLYLLGPVARRELLAQASARLAPGGILLVKETDTTPRWKHRLAAAQEQVSTKLLRITAGTDLDFASSQELEAVLAGEGLRTEVVRLDRHQVHPHVLIAGRRPGGTEAGT